MYTIYIPGKLFFYKIDYLPENIKYEMRNHRSWNVKSFLSCCCTYINVWQINSIFKDSFVLSKQLYNSQKIHTRLILDYKLILHIPLEHVLSFAFWYFFLGSYFFVFTNQNKFVRGVLNSWMLKNFKKTRCLKLPI